MTSGDDGREPPPRTPGDPRPPALGRWLLALALRPGPRSRTLVGDLEELWRERRRRMGRTRASAWYLRQAVTAAWRYRHGGRRRHTRGRGGEAMRDLITGLRTTLRRLAARPGYLLAVTGTLALGVGATATVFSLIEGVLLKPLDYPDASRIVFVYDDNDGIDMPAGYATAANFQEWQRDASSFESLALVRGRSASVTTDVIPEYAYAARVTPGFFDVFATEPALGRRFTDDDAAPGAAPVVILGNGLWTRDFGADPDIVGRTVRIDGEPNTVVGVMPPGFEAHGDWAGLPVQLWRPFPIDEDALGSGRSFHAIGRLADGVDLAAARSEMTAFSARLAQERPGDNRDWYTRVDRYQDLIVGDVAPVLWLMLATTGLLLLVACANVANLSLNRVLDRRGELATRRAIGASRGAIVGLVAGESAVFAVAGGALGLALARGLLALARWLEPGRIPRLDAVTLDGRVVLAVLGVTALSALAVGGAAALAASRQAPADVLRGGGGHGPWGRARNVLVAAQLAVTFALLLGAGLLARSFQGLRSVDLGFDPHDVTALTVALSWDRVPTLDARARFSTEVLERMRQVPGVASAGMINSLPLSGSNQTQRAEIEGIAGPDDAPAFAIRGIGPDYLQTLGIPVLSGRAFGRQDLAQPQVALVNRSAVQHYWGGADPLDAQVRLSGHDEWVRVVGVVGDVHHDGPDREVRPELYLPYSAEYLTSKSYVVRWQPGHPAHPDALRQAVFGVDPEQPVREVRSMDDWVADATAAPRFQTRVMGAGSAVRHRTRCGRAVRCVGGPGAGPHPRAGGAHRTGRPPPERAGAGASAGRGAPGRRARRWHGDGAAPG